MLVRGCWLAAIVASAGADASANAEDLEFSEVLQEVAKRPPALANVRRAARRHDAVREQCDLLRVPAQRFRSWAEVAASLKRHERPVIISGLSSLPVLNLDEHVDEDYPINNGQFGPGKAMRSIPLERYLRGNASSFHIFAINRPQHGLHLEPFLLDQARARAAAAVGEGLADLAARWVFSLGLQASSVNRHSHEESWLILFRGRKAWWIGSGTDSFRGWEDPCGALGTAPPPGVEFCAQRPGEVVYIGTHVDHATCNMDPLVLGVGGQGSRADWPPVVKAVQDGDVEALQKLLPVGDLRAALRARTSRGHSALHVAAAFGRDSSVAELLARRANIKHRDAAGLTALHAASDAGHLGAARLLLRSRADALARDRQGKQPLHKAAAAGHVALVSLLLSHGNVTASSRSQEQPLHVGAGHCRVVQLLLHARADSSARDREGVQPLHWAAASGSVCALRRLLNFGASLVSADTVHGGQAVHWAAANGHRKLLSGLLELRATPWDQDAQGSRPFHWAAANGQTAVAQYLRHLMLAEA